MPLNFWKDNADDGTNTDASIQPINNGDPVEESYLNRAAQNLRKRTEEIRTLVDDLQAITRSDRAFALIAKEDTKVVLDEPTPGSGEYRISINSTGNAGDYDRDIVLMPMLSPTKATNVGPVPARFYYSEDASNGISLEMQSVGGHPRKVSEGSHNIYWQIVKDPSVTSTPIVEVKANDPANPDPEAGPVYIIVKIKADDTSTLSEISSAIGGSAAYNLVNPMINGSGTTAVTLGGNNSWGPYRAYETDEDASVVGFGAQAGVDDEGFRITSSAFEDFFNAKGRRLKDGDTLFLDLTNAKARMQTNTANVFNDASSLHIISSEERTGTDTRNLGDADGPIPLFKVTLPVNSSSPVLVCINQRTFSLDTPDYILNSSTETDNIRSELADNSGTPYGDYMVGAEAKSDGIISLASGTVNSQLKGLVALGNQGSGTSGDSKIGAAAHSGTPHSLTTGNIRDHIASILNYYNGHVSATADQHSDSDITANEKTVDTITLSAGSVNSQVSSLLSQLTDSSAGTSGSAHIGKEAKTIGTHTISSDSVFGWLEQILQFIDSRFTVVDPNATSGSGDYQTIGDAITNIDAAGGGIVIVKEGSYNEALTINTSNPIHIIGGPGTVFSGTLDITGHNGLAIKGIHFSKSAQTGGTHFVNTSGSFEKPVIFENCEFKILSGLSGSHGTPVINSAKVDFRNCLFQHAGTGYDDPAIKIPSSTVNDNIWTRVFNCKFRNFAKLIETTDTNSWGGTLIFRGNNIVECGYSPDSSTIGTLIDGNSSSSTFLWIDISGNVWEDYTESVDVSARFIANLNVSKGGRITGNNLSRTIQQTNAVNASIIESVKSVSAVGDFLVISENCVRGNKAKSFVRNCENVIVAGNSIAYFEIAAAEIISVKNAIVSGNHIRMSEADPNYCQNAISGQDYCVISNNDVAITADANVLLSRSLITIASTSGGYAVVTGNRILISEDVPCNLIYSNIPAAISGNVLIGAGSSNVIGIEVNSGKENVSGNLLDNLNTGIICNNTAGICGNMFNSCSQKIQNIGGHNIGTRNEADNGYTITNNWW